MFKESKNQVTLWGSLLTLSALVHFSCSSGKQAGVVGPHANTDSSTKEETKVKGNSKMPTDHFPGIVSEGVIRHVYEKGEITKLCDEVLQISQIDLDDLAKRFSTNPTETVKTGLLEFETIIQKFNDRTSPLTFMGYVNQDSSLRDEASQCEEKVGQFIVSVYTRKDIYQTIQGFQPKGAEEARLLSETLKAFEKNGLKLTDQNLEEFRKVKKELSTLETKFSANLNNDTSALTLTKEQLAGAPESFLERLKRDGEKYIVTTKSTDYLQVMENASLAETRKQMLLAYSNRAATENTKLLEQAILLRQNLANLMGKETWADYRTDGRMAQTAANVWALVGELRTKLAQRNKADLDRLLAYKKKEFPSATALEAWDIPYYANQVKKAELTLDDEEIRQYFPVDQVMSGMFKIYSRLLGIRFEAITDVQPWHADVKHYRVIDSKTKETIAYFYADYFPRPGKYGHAAAFTLHSGYKKEDGTYSKPIASIVANFTPPSGDKPSLMTHDEVETTFHEFGHIMHQILTRATYSTLSGTSVAQDFVEAPSQMLENWVWDAKMLQLISGHYQTKKPLPPELLKRMLEAKDFNQGYFYTRQLMLGTLDLTMHTTKGPVDVTALHNRIYEEMIGVKPIEGGHFAATFGHLMGGYDAGYYGYIWSEVYAADLFTEFQKKGMLSTQVGKKYRKWILEKGGMQEAKDLIEGFLGRPSTRDAFFKKLKIQAG